MKPLSFLLTLVLLASPSFAKDKDDEELMGFDLGFGLAPLPEEETSINSVQVKKQNIWDNSFKVIKIGYNFFWIFYGSIDSVIMPPSSIFRLTQFYDEGLGRYIGGVYRPGMVNLFDGGIKFVLFDKLVLGAEIGVNQLYIYKLEELQKLNSDINTEVGANIKATLGFKLNPYWGVELNGYSIQPSLKEVMGIFKGLSSSDAATQTNAMNLLLGRAAYSLMLVLYI